MPPRILHNAVRFVMAALFILTALVWPGSAQALNGAWAQDLMLEGDALFNQRGDLAKALEAAECYRGVLVEEPGNYQATRRLIRTLVWVGAQIEGPAKMDKYSEALQLAQRLHNKRPQDPAPLYWLGVAGGLVADNSSPITAYKMVKKLRRDMNRLKDLDPKYEYGGAYRILGRVHTKLPWVMGGRSSKAEEYLKKAIAVQPNYWLNQIYLADLYRSTNRETEARVIMEKVAKGGPIPPGQEAESKLWQNLAHKMLEENPPPEPME
jgi:tetratricopeptide (TPR) repeat protein